MDVYTLRNTQFIFIPLLLFSLIQLSAQDICESLATLKKGTVIEYSNFNKKDKFQSGQKLTVLDQSQEGNKVISKINNVIIDKKKNESMDFEIQMECQDNVFYVDLRQIIDPSLYESMSSLEMEWSGVPNAYSGNMKVGDRLEDSNITMEARSGGVKIMNMSILVKDQEIVAKETITTPAGSFDCFKITSTTELKSILNRTFTSATWFSPVVGSVRTENYDKKGNLTTYSIVTSFVPGR